MRAYLNAPARRIALGTAALRIGSASGNELILNDPLVAPVHAEIAPGEHGYQLTDLASPQGVLVNGQFLFPHVPQQLQNGDIILLGNINLTYEALTTEASAATSFVTHAEDKAPGQAIESEIPDQPTQAEIPALPLVTRELAPSGPGELPAKIAFHASEGTAPAITPTDGAPAYAAPLPAETPAGAPAYAASPSQPLVAPAGPPAYTMQPAPQVYPPFGAPGYAFLQAAAPGTPSQPGYPALAYAQPGYMPLPGQFPATAPTPATAKRNRAFLWVTLIIVVILLVAGSNTATYALTRASTPKPVIPPKLPSPSGVLQTYCQSIISGNADAIYNLLSDQAKIHTSLDDIQKTFEEIKLLNSSSSSMSVQYTYCTFDNIRVSNSLAVATVALTLSLKLQSQTMTEIALSMTSLVWEHNQWKIDFSQMAQPQPTINISGSSATPTPLP
jgi:pSer/pThr/pTyr-binding forkhead associated (FHA) protein